MPEVPAVCILAAGCVSVDGMAESFPNERLDVISRIAEILFDLANSGVDTQPHDQELLDQLKTVGEIILDGLGLNIVGIDGAKLLVEINNPA